MNFNLLAARWLPPVLVEALRGWRRVGQPPEWEYLPQGWPPVTPGATGWNDASVVRAQLEKWPSFQAAVAGTGPLGISHEAVPPFVPDGATHNTILSFGYVLARAAGGKDRLALLDWGGGLGHYALLSQALLPGVRIDYHCKDVAALCEAGRRLLPDAAFFTEENVAFARSYDLVLASSSLQYTRDWPALFRRLAAVTQGWLYITRLPVVHRSPSFVVLQRPGRYGYHTEYLGWFINRQELLAEARAAGLTLAREFLIQEHPHVPGAPEQCEYRGFLFHPAAEATP